MNNEIEVRENKEFLGCYDILGLGMEEHEIAIEAIKRYREKQEKEEKLKEAKQNVIKSIYELASNEISEHEFGVFLDDVLTDYSFIVRDIKDF